MITSSLLNYALGFTTTVTFMMNLGNVDDLLDSATGQPWVALIQRITESQAATIVFLVLMIIMYFFCAVNAVTTSSRQIWSFSRDKGLPFHKFLSKVRPKSGVPMNAVVVTMVITCLVALIIIGSTLAFNIILSISAAALLSSYVVVISCMLWRKLRGEPLPKARFRMPHALGIAVNITAILFSVTAAFFLFWPAAPNPTPASMNWVSLIYGAAVIFATFWYLIRGRYEYEGPVVSSHLEALDQLMLTHCVGIRTKRRIIDLMQALFVSSSHFINSLHKCQCNGQTSAPKMQVEPRGKSLLSFDHELC